MSLGSLLLGWLVLAGLVTGAALVAVAARRRLLPGWRGSRALLADVVLGAGVVEVSLQLLGVLGLLRRPALLIAGAVLVAGGLVLHRRGTPVPDPGSGDEDTLPAVPRLQYAVGLFAAALVTGLWVGQISWVLRHGVLDYDSIDYHLPVAVQWYQTGRIGPLPTTTPDLAVPSFPFGSELFHAAGMVAFGRDVLTPFLNLGWLAVLLLAGWVAGRRTRVPGLTLAAVAIVAGLPQAAHFEAGTGLSDVPALAGAIAALALLAAEAPGRRLLGVVLVGGLAAGLGLGAKPSVGPALLALTVFVAARGPRRLAVWGGAAFATGGFWFVREWLLAGSPFPEIALPLLPRPHYAAFDALKQPVGQYLGNRSAISHYLLPGLVQGWGPSWPVPVLLAVAGGVAALAAGPRRFERFLGVAALGCMVAYLRTPHTGGGPPGQPLLFGENLRFAYPALALGLLALALASARFRFAPPVLAAVFAVPLVAGAVAHWRVPALPYVRQQGTAAAFVAAAGLLAGAVLALRRARKAGSRRGPPLLRPALFVLVPLAVVAGSRPVADGYLAHRYSSTEPGYPAAYAWFRSMSDRRVGVAGFGAKFAYAGVNLTNRVAYVGQRLPYGGFTEATSCEQWRHLLQAGRYDYVVIAPSPLMPAPPPSYAWTATDRQARPVFTSANVTVFALAEPADLSCRAAGAGSR